MRPPKAAEMLLLALAGEADAEFVAGDLAEDFRLLLAEIGRRRARRWYVWQVLRSAPALIALRIRSGELTESVLRATVGVLLPLLGLDQLWRFVYSQIPLKDGLDRAPGLLMVNILAVAWCSWAVAAIAPRKRGRREGPDALAAVVAAALAIRASAGDAPAAYVLCVLAAAPARWWWTMGRRRLR